MYEEKKGFIEKLRWKVSETEATCGVALSGKLMHNNNNHPHNFTTRKNDKIGDENMCIIGKIKSIGGKIRSIVGAIMSIS